jgi:hypothetical protein
VARFAADRYTQFKQADIFGRAQLLEHWRQRKGQMIGEPGSMAPGEQP